VMTKYEQTLEIIFAWQKIKNKNNKKCKVLFT